MSRPVPALHQFLNEVVGKIPSAGYEYGEPDGFGRARSVRFDHKTSKAVVDAVVAVARSDKRIAQTEYRGGKGKERLTVEMVADIRADYRDNFGFGEALDVITAADS